MIDIEQRRRTDEVKQITISTKEIYRFRPCFEGLKTLLIARGVDVSSDAKTLPELAGLVTGEPFPMSFIVRSNGVADAVWSMRCKPEHDSYLWRRFSIWCSLLAIKSIQIPSDDTDIRRRHGAENSAPKDLEIKTSESHTPWADSAYKSLQKFYDVCETAGNPDAIDHAAPADKLTQILDAGTWIVWPEEINK